MADALATLSDRQRKAVVLRFYEDLPEAEIAVLLGCRPGTVKSLLFRALARLREVLPS
jgi:RNA polymerase sigma factor (sigma-70 family)